MKQLFFRDLNHEDKLLDGKTFHAAGVIEDINKPSPGGKDYLCIYYDPFEATVTRQWRSVDEVEVFEANSFEYDDALKTLEKIQNLLDS